MKTKTKLLEWTVSEEIDKNKFEFENYFFEMRVNVVLGTIMILFGNLFFKILGFLWIIAPVISYMISKEYEDEKKQDISKGDKDYLVNIAEKTWGFFKDNINKTNNYLITDNYQLDRKEKIVDRTSSTNIGLQLIVIISAYDMKFINFKECISYLKNILFTVQVLEKWNGHLYNWYNIKKMKKIVPFVVSSVDSGNWN